MCGTFHMVAGSGRRACGADRRLLRVDHDIARRGTRLLIHPKRVEFQRRKADRGMYENTFSAGEVRGRNILVFTKADDGRQSDLPSGKNAWRRTGRHRWHLSDLQRRSFGRRCAPSGGRTGAANGKHKLKPVGPDSTMHISGYCEMLEGDFDAIPELCGGCRAL
jgi:hypothetical protein